MRNLKRDVSNLEYLILLEVGVLVLGQALRIEQHLVESDPHLALDLGQLKAIGSRHRAPLVVHVLEVLAGLGVVARPDRLLARHELHQHEQEVVLVEHTIGDAHGQRGQIVDHVAQQREALEADVELNLLVLFDELAHRFAAAAWLGLCCLDRLLRAVA